MFGSCFSAEHCGVWRHLIVGRRPASYHFWHFLTAPSNRRELSLTGSPVIYFTQVALTVFRYGFLVAIAADNKRLRLLAAIVLPCWLFRCPCLSRSASLRIWWTELLPVFHKSHIDLQAVVGEVIALYLK